GPGRRRDAAALRQTFAVVLLAGLRVDAGDRAGALVEDVEVSLVEQGRRHRRRRAAVRPGDELAALFARDVPLGSRLDAVKRRAAERAAVAEVDVVLVGDRRRAVVGLAVERQLPERVAVGRVVGADAAAAEADDLGAHLVLPHQRRRPAGRVGAALLP